MNETDNMNGGSVMADRRTPLCHLDFSDMTMTTV